MNRRYLKYLFTSILGGALASCGGGGGSPAPAPAPVVPIVGSLSSDCTGANCGAINANSYSGTGIGVWRYNNTSSSVATVDVNIAGVAAGNVATLIFSNGSGATASSPTAGTLASPVMPPADVAGLRFSPEVMAAQQQSSQDDAHAQMMERNRSIAAQLISNRPAIGPAADLSNAIPAAATRLLFTPAVGATKTWFDTFPATPVAHNTDVRYVCLPVLSGRQVVWWVDSTAGDLTAELAAMQASYCGNTGGLARLNTLLGDVWGPDSSKYADLIKEAAGALQDINVVVLNVPNAPWAGYFSGRNNLIKSASNVPPNSSNEALAFFINASQIKTDVNFATSTLLHESTHMVNFYQRTVVRGVVHDIWLEETSAMMTEDIVSPTVIPAVTGGYNKVLSNRLPSYLGTGGNVSYINWPKPLADATPNYAIGGGFGAFLNRRYGLSIYQQLVTACTDGTQSASYVCLDGLIKTNGGSSFSDEFARFGATVFGQLPATGMPAGYGYPATVAGSYALQAKDLSSPSSLVAAAPLGAGYTATSHTYQRDTVAAGTTSYVRNAVVVPANTTLIVIIK